jgi:hypothetical protein
MKNLLLYMAFAITVTFCCTSEAQLYGDDSARRAVLELRSRIENVNNISKVSICPNNNPNIYVGDERLGEIELNRGDTEARKAIRDLRKRVILLEVSCEIASKNFMAIPPIGFFAGPADDELRRAILDLRQRLEILREKIKVQVAQKNQNIETEQLAKEQQRLTEEAQIKEQQRLALEASEISRLRAEAEESKRKQAELEQQLKQAQQVTPMPTQTASIGAVGRRIALVVGNANYKVRPLKNPRNDADDVSRSLKTTGFDVIDLRDATLPQMRTAVRQFGDRLINNDVGLVYYSGHGVEVKGRNYFIPVNADIQREDEIADQGLDVSLILEKMNTAGKGVNILIVDACRDDPFGRSFRSSSRGLANMDAPRGTIIAYATSPGKVASDGDPRERNSPYTKHLVKAMQSPNKPIEQVFKEVRRAVQDETKNQQTPWENTSLSGDFFFRVQR